jgi:hypothetical protein
MKRFLKAILGGFLGGLLGIGASVVVTFLAVWFYSDDPSAGSIGGLLPMLFVPLGILIGMVRGAKKDEES